MNFNFLRNKKWNLQNDNGPQTILGMVRTEAKNKNISDTPTIPQPKIISNQNVIGAATRTNGSLTVRCWLCLVWRLGRFPELPSTALEEGSKNESLKRFVGQHPGGRVFPRGPWREILDIGFYPPSLGKGV